MQNILITQAMKLVKEKWYDVDKAVSIAFDNQKARWMINDKWLTELWKKYSTLTSEQRNDVRNRNYSWENLDSILKDYE